MRHLLVELIRCYGHYVPFDKGKFRLALWAYQHLRPLPTPMMTKLGATLTVEVDPNEFVQSQIYYLGYYELYLAKFFRQLMHPSVIFADVGAHVGQYTLLAGERGAQVHAFEPNPHNFQRLRRNVALNNLVHVMLNQTAVADQRAMSTLYLPSFNNTGSGSLQAHDEQLTETIAVQTSTLDLYFAALGTGPHVIKMDVEGAEVLALNGARQTLHSYRPLLILEASDRSLRAFGQSVGVLLDLLKSFDYQMYSLHRRRLQSLSSTSQRDYDNIICVHPDSPLKPPS